jgi:cysteine desulfurase / selenocysteine lyase
LTLSATRAIEAKTIEKDFPFLKDTVFLDSAATSQMPLPVCEAMSEHYRLGASNVHRGVYEWSVRATDRFEETRRKVAAFIGAEDECECIFTSGTTDSLNLIAQSWGETNIAKGDTIVVTLMEHHSNLLPWTQLAERKKAKLIWWDVTDEGELDLEQLPEILESHPKLVALTWVSNVLGTINPIEDIVPQLKEHGATVVLDGAQGVPHIPCDIKTLGVDFLAFSAHKMLGPTGIGVLWGRRDILEKMPPCRFGGSMILSVRQDRVLWAELPHKFEGGTPNISGVHGLGAAIDYLNSVGMDKVRQHEIDLTTYAFERFGKVQGLKLYGPPDPQKRSGVMSFDFRGIHPHDLATLIGREGVCARAGHHCCQPLMRKWGRQGTTRASFYIYSTKKDVDALADALEKAALVFKDVI